MARLLRFQGLIHSSKLSVSKRSYVIDLIYPLVLAYVVVYSINNRLYLRVPPLSHSVRDQKLDYEISNVTVTPVTCAFRASSQYEIPARIIWYFLLIVTIVIRNHDWLAAGAVASVMTYSSVAAIHMIVLFTANNMFDLSLAKTHCESIPTTFSESVFMAGRDIMDPDWGYSFDIVRTSLLAALSIGAWSTTFKGSKSKPILIFWILLLGIAHSFFKFTITDVDRHFQICPLRFLLTYGDFREDMI